MKKLLLTSVAALSLASTAHAQVYITEFFYQGLGSSGDLGFAHEFVELTNTGTSSVSMADWRFDDAGGSYVGGNDLSALGTIAAGQSVVLTDLSAADFRTLWGLDASVLIVGGITNNLGRNDTINIYNSSQELVDTLQFGDQDIAGSNRYRYVTGITTVENLGQNNVVGWSFSNIDSAWESGTADNLTSANGDIGNPGYVNFETVPEPGTYALMGLGLAAVLWKMRRRRVAC